MATKIGVVIAADGEQKFAASMRNCATAAKTLQSDLKTLKNDFKESANSMEYLRQRQDMLKSSQEAYQRSLAAAKSGLSHQKSVYKEQQKSLEELKKKLDDAKKAVKDYEKAGDTSSKGYKDAAKAVDDYSKAVDKQSVELTKSEGKLNQWEHAVNSAQHDLNAANKAIDENARYLNEAENSADHCATSIDRFGKEVREAGDDAEKTGTKVGSMMDKIKTGALEKVGHLATQALAKLGQKAVEAAKYVIDVGSTFEASMSKVEALSGASGSDLDALKDKASELGRTTVFSASEVADAMSNMALAGWNTREMLTGIDGVLQLAAAGGMDLASASDAVAGYLAAFNMEASESGKLADVMATAQAKSKTSTTQLAEAYGTCATNMTQAGQEMTTTTALLEGLASVNDTGSAAGTKLSAVMAQITKKMKDGKIAIGDTQVSVTDSTGAFRDMVDIVEDVEKATDGMTDAQRATALQATFNRQSMSGLNELLAVGSTNLRQYKEDLENSEGAAGQMAGVMQDNFQGAVKAMNSATEGLGNALYEKVSGPLTGAVQLATSLINGITDAITPQQTALDKFLQDINTGVEEVNGLVEAAEQEKQEAETKAMELDAYKQTILDLQGIIQRGGKLDTYQIYQMKTAVDAVSGEIPQIGQNFDAVTGRINITTSTLEVMFEKAKQGILETAMSNALASEYEAVAKAQVEQAKAQAAVNAAQENLNAIREEYAGQNLYDDVGGYTEAGWKYAEAEQAAAKELENAQKAQDNATKSLENAQKQCDLTKKAVEGLTDAETGASQADQELANRESVELQRYKKMKGAVDDTKDAVNEYSEAEEEAAQKIAEANQKIEDAHNNSAEAIKQAYDSAKQAIESSFSVDPTKQIDTEDKGQTVEQLTRNLQGQLEAWQNYQRNLEIIKEHVGQEIAPEFMQYLIGMGEDGANTMQHIVDTLNGKVEDGTKTGSEVVKELSDTYVEGLNMQDEISTELAQDAVVLQTGLNKMGSSKIEWNNLSTSISSALSGVSEDIRGPLLRAYDDAMATARQCGVAIPEGIADGIESADNPEEVVGNMIEQIKSATEGHMDGLAEIAQEAGIHIPEKIKEGIDAGGSRAVDAYNELLELLSETDFKLESTGKEKTEELATGMTDASDTVSDAAQTVASDAASAVEDTQTEFETAGQTDAQQFAAGITGAQSDAVTAATTMAQTALAGARSWETQWYGVGVNMAQGLSQGIQSQVQAVANQAANLVRQALQAAKNTAGVASPAKKWKAELGVMLGKGTALGIKQSAKETAKAAEYIMGKTLAAAQTYASKHKNQISSISDMWLRIGAYESSNNFGIKNYTTKTKNGKTTKTKKDTETYYGEILSAAKKYIDDVEALYTVSDADELKYWERVLKRLKKGTSAWYDAKKTIKSLKADIADAKYDKVVEDAEAYVEGQKRANNMSIRNEIDYWNKILTQLKKGSSQYKQVAEKIADLKAQIGTMAAANNLLDVYHTYYDMSEKALMEYWDKVRKQYKAGTADRIAADKKYLDAAKNYNEQLKRIEDDHREATEEANKAYLDAIKDRTKAIMDAYDLFDAFESNSATGKELLFNIEAQAAGYEEWSDSIRDLEQRGIFSDELMQALTEKGPQDIAAIKALLMLTDEELRKYQAAYDRKETAAAEQAEKDSKKAREDRDKALAEANEARATELAKLNASISSELTSLVSQLKTLAEDETDRIVAAITGGKAPESVGKNVVAQAAPAPASTPAPAAAAPKATTSKSTAASSNAADEKKKKADQILHAIKTGTKRTKKLSDADKKAHGDLWEHIVSKYGYAPNESIFKTIASVLGVKVGKSVSSAERTKILKAMKAAGLAGGTRSLSGNWAWMDEDLQTIGPEMIIRKSDNAILTRLKAHDAVVPANLTDNLFKWGAINPDALGLASEASINGRLMTSMSTQTRMAQQANGDILAALATIISYMPEIAAGMRPTIDGRQLVQATSEYMGTALAMSSRRKR